MPYAAVNDVKTALEHPHTRARDMVVEVDHRACGRMKLVNTPMKFSGAEVGVTRPPPMLGEDTDAVLGELLGMSGKELEGLKERGVVR